MATTLLASAARARRPPVHSWVTINVPTAGESPRHLLRRRGELATVRRWTVTAPEENTSTVVRRLR